MTKQTSYDELTPEMREQVDATLDNVKNNIFFNMDEYEQAYLREHIANTVMTCLYIQNQARQKATRRRVGRML